MRYLTWPLALLLAVVTACDDPAPTAATPDADAVAETAEVDDDAADAEADGPPPLPDDLDMQPEDFECLTNWTKVRRFYVTNKAGRLDETLAVANAPEGKRYPVGTIIQLVPFEAMVKRKAGFSPQTDDWEFFDLENTAQGTTIKDRGTVGVENQFGAECVPCHSKAEPQWDWICETDHGCDPLGLTDFVIESFVDNDPRCAP